MGDTSEFINYGKVGKSISETLQKKRVLKEYEYYLNPKRCAFCNNELSFVKRKLNFCSRTCSNKNRKLSKESKEKISKSVKKFIKENPEQYFRYLEKQKNNDKVRKKFSSAGERELLQIVQNKYPNLYFTSGGNFKISDNIIKPLDIYSKDLKLIIEYDGIYHFKDIYGNLADVQKKDKLLNNWCKENGWKIIRINENTFRTMKDEAVDEIYKMIDRINEIETVNYLYWKKEIM